MMPGACSVLACGIAVACNSASTPGGTARDAAGARPDNKHPGIKEPQNSHVKYVN